MSRFEKRMLLGLALLVILLSVMEAMVPQPTDWSPSYSRHHRSPYGSQFVYDRLTDLFPEVIAVTQPPYAYNYGDHGDLADHVFINTTFAFDRLNVDRLLAMTEAGDHLFIAAEFFQGPLADTLGIETESRKWFGLGSDTSDIRFVGEQRIAQGVFRFSRGFPDIHFSEYDESRTRVLAVNGSSEPVLLQMTWGEGRIILCSAPLAFTNYNLIKGNNAKFIAGALSTLPYRTVFWDESVKAGTAVSNTPLRYILSQPALRWAWYLTLGLIILYMLTYARRQQRAIPIVRPLRNATRDLAHTIGRLYWHKGDHVSMARRMIANFKEDVRARAYLRTFNYEDTTLDHLAKKTGLPQEEVARRFKMIEQREQAGVVTEAQLLELSNELHEFRQLL